MEQAAGRAEVHLSPDGRWSWDGTEWHPTGVQADVAARRGSRRPWLAILGGITALVSLPVVLAGSALPFINWTDTSNGASSSIFGPGFAAGYWFAVEPVAVVLCALPASILLIALRNPAVRAATSGLLVAFGVQTVAMFLGYTFGDLGFGRIGPGGPVGLIGGSILFAGGAFGVGSLFIRD